MNNDLLTYLESFVTPRRLDLFERILSWRTNYITVALEDIYQSNNASAVLRSCDCFGIQNVHVIENRNEYELNSEVTMGSEKWLDLIKFNNEKKNSLSAINYLKSEGYRIIATTPHKDDVILPEFNLEKGKLALFFGTELSGLSDDVINNADEFLKIPMFGFTESFNISVSAAIILQNLVARLHKSGIEWELNETEKQRIKLEWLRRTIKSVELIEKQYLEGKKK